MGIFVTIIIVAFFAHWTCSLISMLALHCRGIVAWAKTLWCAVNSLLSTEERVSHYFLMLPLVLNPTNDSIAVLKQSTNRAIILAKILCYTPHAVFSHFLEVFPFSFYKLCTRELQQLFS